MYADLIGKNGKCQRCPPRCKTCEQHTSPGLGALCLECNGCNYFGFCTPCDPNIFIRLLFLFITYVAFLIRYGNKFKIADGIEPDMGPFQKFLLSLFFKSFQYVFLGPIIFFVVMAFFGWGCELFQTYIYPGIRN